MGIITLKPWNQRPGDELYSTNILNRIRAKLIGMPEADIQLFEPPGNYGSWYERRYGLSSAVSEYG